MLSSDSPLVSRAISSPSSESLLLPEDEIKFYCNLLELVTLFTASAAAAAMTGRTEEGVFLSKNVDEHFFLHSLGAEIHG